MTDQTVTEAAGLRGRPSAGVALTSQIAEAKVKRDRQRDLRPLSALIPLVADHLGLAVVAAVALLASTVFTLGLTGAARRVLDQGFGPGSGALLDRSFAGLAGVALLLALSTGVRFYSVNRLGEQVVTDLRRRLYAHVLTLDQAYFLRTRTGEVLSRMTTDIAIVETTVGSSTTVAIRNLLTALGALAWMLLISPRLTGCVLLIVPAVLLLLILFGRRVRRLSVMAQDRFADAVGYAGECLDQLDTVQAFGREAGAAARFGAAVEGAFRASLARIAARALLTMLVMAFMFTGVAGVLWLGAQSVRIGAAAIALHQPVPAGAMTGGALLQFIFLAVLAASSVGSLGEVWGDVQKTAGAMHRINELLAARPQIAAPARPVAMPDPPRGEIAFEAVTFHYPTRDDLPALNGFSLQVRPGETVALVGPSGAGKSTVLRLLLRFYDPQSGAVRIDGVNLRDADPAEARARTALVAQDASLFSGSAQDNIRFGREAASDEEVRAAARAAEADRFIDALPEGFSGPLGERGRTLSGGQRQRLAIARALVRQAPILLLDEATSALDAENERLVQQALYDAMAGRTTLVIAHRLATVLRADRIVVMDAGRVVEEGRHAELVERDGLYARLARLQFQV